jgi:hypothetical protein
MMVITAAPPVTAVPGMKPPLHWPAIPDAGEGTGKFV